MKEKPVNTQLNFKNRVNELILRSILLFLALMSSVLAVPQVMAVSKDAARPKVLTTIKPLQMIVHELSEGVFQPSRLLPNGFTPHDYHLKPRDRLAVQDAELIVWLGPVMEPYLIALVAQLEDQPSSQRVNVTEIAGLEILPSRSIS